MSDHVDQPTTQDPATPARRGQSLVEFALVLPMLLVLLLGVADFGRAFQAGITLEAIARDSAEVAALQRLRDKPPSDPLERPAYYGSLQQLIARTACAESDQLALSPEQVHASDCPSLTAVRACIHDGKDTECGDPIPGFDGAVPAECTDIATATAPAWSNAAGTETSSHWVEVRVCYHFTTLFNLNLALPMNAGLGLGDVYLQKTRTFVLDCPPPAGIGDHMLNRRPTRGQTMVELALIAPLFFMVIFGIIILGIGVFYQQQIAHAAREAARFAVVNTGSSQCPTVSNLPPDAAVVTGSYWACDPPATRWPKMTAHTRASVFGLSPSAVHVSACWSGHWTKDSLGNWADYDALPRQMTSPYAANPYRQCTIGALDPRLAAESLSCPGPATTAADDMASSYVTSTGGNANQVTVYACYEWQPPLAGFLLIPSTITFQAVVTEALQYQQ